MTSPPHLLASHDSSDLLLSNYHLGRPNPHIDVRAIAAAAAPLGGN